MNKTTRESLFTLGYIVVGLIAVVAVDYLTCHRPMLPFIIVGLTGALIYAAAQMRGPGSAILMIVLLFMSQVAMMPPIRPNTLAAAALYALPIGFALMAASYVLKSITRVKFGRFLVMGLIVGAGYALMLVLWLVRLHKDIRFGLILNQAFLGAKLGAAMGLGFELIDLIGPRPKHEPDYDRPAA